jgi:hypothetical protein
MTTPTSNPITLPTTGSDSTPITTLLSTPDDLLAAVPFLIGYHPQESLVIIALKKSAIGMAMRMDFPATTPLELTACAAQIAMHLHREGADSAIIVGYLPQGANLNNGALDEIAAAIKSNGISLSEVVEVSADRFRSTLCQRPDCCPPEGLLLQKSTDSRISAEQVALGHPMPFAGLAEMRESIAALPKDKELIRAIRAIEQIDYEELDPAEILQLQREGALAVNTLSESYGEVGIGLDRSLLALVLVRLHDLQVRDYAMGLATPEDSLSLWAMWRWILRIAPKGYIAPVASIFATASYERGEGALAQRALDRALEDDSRYQMAKLLRRTFAAGWPPESFSTMRAELHPKICAALFSE